MNKKIEENITGTVNLGASLEQINDYMEILDLRIRRLLVTEHKFDSDSTSRGLFIMPSEIGEYFQNEPSYDKDTSEITLLDQEITALEAAVEKKNKSLNESNIYSYFDKLCSSFQLMWLERQIALICISSEIDKKYERTFGFLRDDLTVHHPTLEVVLKLLSFSRDEYLQYRVQWLKGGNLQKYMLVPSQDLNDHFSLSKELRLRTGFLSYIFTGEAVKPMNSDGIKVFAPNEELDSLVYGVTYLEKLESIAALKGTELGSRLTIINMIGNSGSGRQFVLRHLCKKMQTNLLVINMDLLYNEDNYENTARQIVTEMLLHQAELLLKFSGRFNEKPDEMEVKATAIVRVLINSIYELDLSNKSIFIASDNLYNYDLRSEKAHLMSLNFDIPKEKERQHIWETLSANYSFADRVDWGEYASKFRFTPGQIKDTLESAFINAAVGGATDGIRTAYLTQSCYQQSRSQLGRKSTKIEPQYAWEDLILPENPKEQLRNACNQIKYRQKVYGDWGFGEKLAYGKGLCMLFSGPPGTGKTMAAQVVAGELELELFKIDISQLVSKYIGETEKNIAEIFKEAQLSNAILFFDEADAMFGKRSEVKDSNDRYANIETAFLLQKVEEYEGVSILASNFQKNIDEAFLRRFNFIIEFPFPDAQHREKIWRLIFPGEAPLSAELDFSLIAEKFALSGGNIKNAAVSAAFLAAGQNEAIGNAHIIDAIKTEMAKSGKIVVKEDIEEFNIILNHP